MAAKKVAPMASESWPRELRSLGERVRFARERIGMTKVALAELSDTDQSTVTRIEQGTRLAQLPSLIAMSRALGVPVGWLIAGEGPLPEPVTPPAGSGDKRRRDS